MSDNAVVFVDNDLGYQEWVKAHPEGFVINTYRDDSSKYAVLHRSGCDIITVYTAVREPGAFTCNKYRKVCADSIAILQEWLKANGRSGGDFSSDKCASCRPRAIK